MRNKLGLLGNCVSGCVSRCVGFDGNVFSGTFSRTSRFFSSTCSAFSGTGCFFGSTFSYNGCIVSLFCTCRKSRNSKSKAAGYSEHFAEVSFGSHLKYPLWMNYTFPFIWKGTGMASLFRKYCINRRDRRVIDSVSDV